MNVLEKGLGYEKLCLVSLSEDFWRTELTKNQNRVGQEPKKYLSLNTSKKNNKKKYLVESLKDPSEESTNFQTNLLK
jgi:hypothetical protein